ncbi:MAG: UDP-N-acetylmuramoyl-tripeptide--D-alanyl-D-alanine ligase [Microthrixaceae bacterium]
MQFSTAELADALAGVLQGPPSTVTGLAIDSRIIASGQMFAAVRGERDGHDFLRAAFENGAGAALIDKAADSLQAGESAVLVDDVNTALADLARLARSKTSAEVIGITGSVGKTTTKDMLASVLGQSLRTASSEKSFNNELGVPLTLANAPEGTEATVVEMGARGIGHISYLCSMARPRIGVVTTVDAVHTEVMGGLEQIAIAKGELIESLPSDGLAVLNADVALVKAMSELTSAEVLTFGRSGDVRARGIEVDGDLMVSFVIVSPWGEVAVRLGARGAHNVSNALAAASVALHLGLPLDEVAEGLGLPLRSPWRMDLSVNGAGASILNDCYNASPTSMDAALRGLAGIEPRNADADREPRKLAVVGLMAELGDSAAAEHRDIAVLSADLGIELLAVGTDLYGVESVPDIAAATQFLRDWNPGAGDAVLVKGSRVAGLEMVAQELLDWGNQT